MNGKTVDFFLTGLKGRAKRGDLFFFWGKSWISKAITKATNGGPSHVAIYLGDGRLLESTIDFHFNLKRLFLYIESGVQINNLSEHHIKNNTRIKIMRVKRTTKKDIEDAINWGMKKLGTRYAITQLFIDYLAIKLGLMHKKTIIDELLDVPNSMVCSEFVAKAFYYGAQIRFSKVKLGLTRPSDIEQSKRVELIYELKL